jgi:hypothetical protein
LEGSIEMARTIRTTELERTVLDGAELAGSTSIFSPFVGRVLYKRLEEVLLGMVEPGILVVDFARVGLVDSSTLLISIAELLALVQRNGRLISVVCSGTTKMHQGSLSSAIIHYPYAASEWDESKRLLLLVSDREIGDMWHLLGELTEREKIVWDLATEAGCTTIADLIKRSGLNRRSINSSLQVLLQNRVLMEVRTEGEDFLCPVGDLVTANQRE